MILAGAIICAGTIFVLGPAELLASFSAGELRYELPGWESKRG